MDSLIAVKGKDFVIIASDTTNAYSVLRMKVQQTPYRTTMIKFGISMARSYWPLEDNIQMCSYSEIIFKKTYLSCNTKTDTNCQSMTPHSSSDRNWQKLLEKALIQLIVFSLDLRVISLDSIGSIISVQ